MEGPVASDTGWEEALVAQKWSVGAARIAAALAVALLAGCGASGGERAIPEPGGEPAGSEEPSGWLAGDDSSAVYVDYRERAGTLSGTLQTSSIEPGDAGFEVKGQSQAFTGTLEGSDLSITAGGAAPWFGTLEKGELTLNLPQDDGALAPLVLRPASIADYNDAVAALRTRARSLNDQETEADNEAALDEEAAEASAAFDDALTDLGSAGRAAGDEGDGTVQGAYDSAIADYEAAWQEMQDSEAEMRRTDCFDVGFAADDVGFARDGVGFARDTLGFVDRDAATAAGRIDAAVDTAERAYDTAAAAAAAAGNDPPLSRDLETMTADGRDAQAALDAKRASARARADEIDAAADALNASARQWADSRQC